LRSGSAAGCHGNSTLLMGSRIEFGKEVVTFRFFASDKGMAENVAKILGCNEGQNLLDPGMFTVAESERGSSN